MSEARVLAVVRAEQRGTVLLRTDPSRGETPWGSTALDNSRSNDLLFSGHCNAPVSNLVFTTSVGLPVDWNVKQEMLVVDCASTGAWITKMCPAARSSERDTSHFRSARKELDLPVDWRG